MTVIVEATDADAPRWEQFVHLEPTATFFHQFGWRRAIRDAYGYRAIYLMAVRGGDVVGVLPLIDVNSPLLGRSLISTAFTVGGGVASSDPEAARLLASAARAAGQKRRVRYVELRGPAPEGEGWAVKDTVYAGFERDLPLTADDVLKSIPQKRRAEVRKGVKRAEAGEIEIDLSEDVDLFYDLYADACRTHGTPIYPRRFAQAVWREFAASSEIMFIRAGGRPIYVIWTFFFRDRTMPYYIGADAALARAHNAYDFGMYRVMLRALERGARRFDFGRSKYGTGAFENKTYWGFEPTPLPYSYALIGAREMPNVNPNNPKFSRVAEAWKKLPRPVANIAGPLLAPHLA
jgi:FemAB-related protein (PEP-CTERM system-associated)